MNLEVLLKLRDAHQMITDALTEEIEKHVPTEPKTEPEPYDLMKVVTHQAKGEKGHYLKVLPEANKENRDYELFIAHLKKSGGKLTKQGYFCWLFSDNVTAGMKLSNKGG